MTEVSRNTQYPIDGRAERILAAAFTEFSRRGFRAARLGVIARRAGVSLATFRRYFPSRDELFREVIRSAIVHRVFGPPQSGTQTVQQTTAVRVREFGRQFWRTMAEPEHGALLRLSVGELSAFPELAVFHTTEVVGQTANRVEALLVEGVQRGELRPHDVRTAARVITAALLTHAVWFASPEIYGGLTGASRERSEEAVLDFFIEALSDDAV